MASVGRRRYPSAAARALRPALCAGCLFFSSIALAQPGPGLSGDRHWKTPVADVGALPTTGNLEGDCRLVMDGVGEVYWFHLGTWKSSSSAAGPEGPAGADGTMLYSGGGAPSSILGLDGDAYLDVVSGAFYRKAAGAWTASGSLRGPVGANGMNGANGAPGTPGATGSPGPPGVVAATAPLAYDAGTQTVSLNPIGLPQLAGTCTGPGKSVQWDGAGVASCIATPTGGGGSGSALFAFKAGDETYTNNTTLHADSDLALPVTTASVYSVRMVLFYTHFSAGIQVAFGCTCTVANMRLRFLPTDGSSAGQLTALGQVGSRVTAGGASEIAVEGVIEVATAGILSVQWAQANADGNALRVFRDSFITASKM